MNEHTPTDRDAVIAADTLLVEIIRNQPNMLTPKYVDGSTGQQVAEFVTELRTGLIDMFKSQP